jgi:hypothetical protein
VLLLPSTPRSCQAVVAAAKLAATPVLLPRFRRCRCTSTATAVAFISIVIVVAVILAVSFAVAAAAFSWLLVVACAPAIAIPAGVFVATAAVRGGSTVLHS